MNAKPSTIIITSRCAQTIYAQRRTLATAAQSDGWRVLLVGESQPNDVYRQRLADIGLPFAHVPVRQKSKNPIRLILLFLAYFSILRREKPAIFHAFTIKPTVIGLLAAKAAGVPLRIATVAGLGHVFLSSSAISRRIALVLLRFSFRLADRVMFYNEDDLELFKRLGLVRSEQAMLVRGSGVDTVRFQPVPCRPSRMEPFVVLFVGRLLQEKGILDLIEAARRLKAAESAIRFEIVGDLDPNNPSSLQPTELQKLIDEGLFVSHGFVEDLRPHLARSDAVVLPSYREGIPLSLLEGAAMAKPLIATDVPGCRDVVRPGETGFLVPPQDPAALAAAIETLARDPALAQRMGEAARVDVEERFSATVVTGHVLDEYRRLSQERTSTHARSSDRFEA